MKVLFHLTHPAHYHLFYPTILRLRSKGWEILITIRQKDVLERLLKDKKEAYKIIPHFDTNVGALKHIVPLFYRTIYLLRICRKYRPNFLISSASEVALVGWMLRETSLLFFEDDLKHVKQWAIITAPFASLLICPKATSAFKWEYKTIKYDGYHELAYLHPNIYSRKFIVLKKNRKHFLIRLAKLDAYHDSNNMGISDNLFEVIILKLKRYGDVYISTERELRNDLKRLCKEIIPSELIYYMPYMDLYIGDSQTMAAEAAVLGVPSLRFNDFVGKLGYLEELEHSYGLTFGIKSSEPDELLLKIDELLSIPNIKKEWNERRRKMLSEKINVTDFFVWLIENYPESFNIMQNNPDYQYMFK